MPLSTDVNLPKSHRARFPDECVVCHRQSPEGHARLFTGAIGWWTWLLWWSGGVFSVKAPACTWCAWRLQLRRLVGLLITLGVCVAFLFFVWPMVKESVPPGWHRLTQIAMMLVAISPLFVFEVFWPPPFSVTAFEKSIDYEFASLGYALTFAEQNRDAAWVKVEGEPYGIKEPEEPV